MCVKLFKYLDKIVNIATKQNLFLQSRLELIEVKPVFIKTPFFVLKLVETEFYNTFTISNFYKFSI